MQEIKTVKIENWSQSWRGQIGTANLIIEDGNVIKITAVTRYHGRHGQKGQFSSYEFDETNPFRLGHYMTDQIINEWPKHCELWAAYKERKDQSQRTR